MKIPETIIPRRIKPASILLLITIAFPIIISQMAETVMLFTDRLFLSHISGAHMSAAMAGGLTAFASTTLFIGIIGYLTALSGQYLGAREPQKCSKAAAQGIFFSIMVYPILLLMIPILSKILRIFGQSELAIQYLQIIMFGSIFSLLRHTFSSFFSGIGKTKIVMVANLFTMTANLFLNYCLIFGKFGFPRWEIRGAAIATIISSFIGFTILAAYYFNSQYGKFYETKKTLQFDKHIFKRLIRFGVPAGIEFCLACFAFNFFVLLMHSYSTSVAESVTITFNWDLVAFLPLTGIGIATTALVGRYRGAGNIFLVKKSVRSGLKLSLFYSVPISIFFITNPEMLVGIFNNSKNLGNDFTEVASLAKILLQLTSLYLIADGILLVFGGALRGTGDTKWAMIINVCIHWFFAIICLILAKVFHANPIVVWIFFVLMIMSIMTGFIIRFKSDKWQKISFR